MNAGTEEQLERECVRFCYREAELLDRAEFTTWLTLLHPDVDYRVPVRTTRDNRDGDGFSTKAYFMREDVRSLRMRVERLESPYNWAENPRTRTRRMIGNIRVGPRKAEDVPVANNLVVFCHRGDASAPLVLTCERQDILRQHDGQWRLVDRLVLLDSTVLGLESLSILL